MSLTKEICLDPSTNSVHTFRQFKMFVQSAPEILENLVTRILSDPGFNPVCVNISHKILAPLFTLIKLQGIAQRDLTGVKSGVNP
jgi:hypothetical protein